MNRNTSLSIATLFLAFITAKPVSAGLETAQGSFVFSFDITNITATDTVDLDPFSGTAEQLTGVILDLASRLVVSENDATESSLSVGLDGDVIGIVLNPLPGEQEVSSAYDLLALGFDQTLFVGGLVVFDLMAFSDEGNITGLWYAGQGVPVLGVPAFGGVELTYEFAGSLPVPASGSLPLFAIGVVALTALRKQPRRARGVIRRYRQKIPLRRIPTPGLGCEFAGTGSCFNDRLGNL